MPQKAHPMIPDLPTHLPRSLIAALAAWAAPAPADPAICDAAARFAADQTGVPLSVLMAIARTETGRTDGGVTQPWPWTINKEGNGHWFDGPEAALTFARESAAAGATSFDMGCFQINYRWHGQAFASLDQMLDPMANALYAADFLTRLHAESGDWSVAAGAYHSRTAEHATRYRGVFDGFRADLIAADVDSGAAGDIRLVAAETPAPLRENWFPLLQPGAGPARLGSLVPLGG
jgi:hypothetical protein